jgi:histidine triad (HIT) family protein
VPADPSSCLFCRVVAGEIPGDVVLETDRVLAFRDIDPQAPTHVLVVPRAHHADLDAVSDTDPGLLTEVLQTAVAVARQEELTGGFRLVANTGSDGGQTVHHLHLHVLGGRAMHWPPG